MHYFFKKPLLFIFSLFSLSLILITAFFFSGESQIASSEELAKLKAGKEFWTWQSPYGPLDMHYIEKGQGDRHILMIHGFRSHSYTWKALIDPLAEAGFHVWAIDLVGYGLSDKPDHTLYNLDFFIEQIHAFIEGKGIKKAHLIGNSMGGGLALSMALAHPEQVQSLVLLDALGYPLEIPFYLSISKYVGKLWAPFVGPTLIRYGLKQIMHDKNKVSDEQVEAYCLPYRFPKGVITSILTLQQFNNEQLIEIARDYPTLNSPILIIWGDHDTLIPMSHYEKFTQDFPHANRLLIPNCGHIPQEEAPDQVLEALLNFFATIKPTL